MRSKTLALAALVAALLVGSVTPTHAQQSAPTTAPECLAADPPRSCREDERRQYQGGAAPSCAPIEAGAPRTIVGTGSNTSAPFSLDGGAYRVDWSMSGKGQSHVSIRLGPATVIPGMYSELSLWNGSETVPGGDQTYIYRIQPGSYYLSVRAPAGWSITLTPIAV